MARVVDAVCKHCTAGFFKSWKETLAFTGGRETNLI